MTGRVSTRSRSPNWRKCSSWARVAGWMISVSPCSTGPESVRAEILVRMGAMSMTFAGTVEIVEKDDAAHRAVMRVKSKETGGTGYANADVTFTLSDGGGTVHTAAQISGKAASMGEGVVQSVLDALVTDFTGKLATL